MSVIYVLLAISIVLAVAFFVVFVIAVKKGQYDDAYTPSVRMLFDNDLPQTDKSKKSILTKKNKPD